jgi:hypothetical protein
MGPKSAFLRLCGLLIASVLCVTSRSWADTTARKPVDAAVDSPVAFILERVRRTGSFNHPDYPWVVRARWVRGDTMYFVELLHRRKDGKGFDDVGNALQATLSFSQERDTLRVHVCQMEMENENGTRLEVEERLFDLTPPTWLRESGCRSYAEAEACLSRRQQEILGKQYSLSPEQESLLAAFGKQGCGLLRAEISTSKTGRTVLAYERAGTRRSGRLVTFGTIAVARFDRKGKVLQCFGGNDITADRNEVNRLILGDDSHSLTLIATDGQKFILPGIKSAQ